MGVNLQRFSEKIPRNITPINDNEKIRISEDKNQSLRKFPEKIKNRTNPI